MISWLQGVWPLIAHAGSGGLLIAGLLAAAWFSPVFKKELVYGAIVVAVALFVFGVGVHDEKVKRDAQEQRVQVNVDGAVKDALTSTKKDPFDDPRK